MTYIPGHSAVVYYKAQSGSITESTNGITAATLPAAPTGLSVLGYTNLPQASRGLGNSKGFALGVQGAAYNKRGVISPTLSIEIRPGNVQAIADMMHDPSTGTLPSLYIVVATPSYSDAYWFCKLSSLDFNLNESNEITLTANFMAIAQTLLSGSTADPATVRALGTPLFWHDVRGLTATDSVGTTRSLLRSVMSMRGSVDYGLERKNQRPDFGDNAALSRTSYALLEHHRTVTGELTLHERLPADYFTSVATAQEWGDLVADVTNNNTDNLKGFTLTFSNALPTDETSQGGDSSSEINYTVPFAADDIDFTMQEPEEEEG